jgi:phosphoribosylformylglycinamidine synthase
MPSPNTVAQRKPFDAVPHTDGLTQSRFILTVKPENVAAVEAIFGSAAAQIGTVTADAVAKIAAANETITLDVKEVQTKWEEAIPCLLKQKA